MCPTKVVSMGLSHVCKVDAWDRYVLNKPYHLSKFKQSKDCCRGKSYYLLAIDDVRCIFELRVSSLF